MSNKFIERQTDPLLNNSMKNSESPLSNCHVSECFRHLILKKNDLEKYYNAGVIVYDIISVINR